MRTLSSFAAALRAPAGGAAAVRQRPEHQQGGKEIGRDEYSIQRGSNPRATIIKAQARYPAISPSLQIAPPKSDHQRRIGKFELDVQSPEGNIVILAAGTGARLIVSLGHKGSEAGRELPGGRDLILLDDNVYSLYLPLVDAATPTGARLTAIFPRSGRRATWSLGASRAGGSVRVQLDGEITGTLTADAQGRLQRLDLPGAGIVVTPAKR